MMDRKNKINGMVMVYYIIQMVYVIKDNLKIISDKVMVY
jgi:hypothetical protein